MMIPACKWGHGLGEDRKRLQSLLSLYQARRICAVPWGPCGRTVRPTGGHGVPERGVILDGNVVGASELGQGLEMDTGVVSCWL